MKTLSAYCLLFVLMAIVGGLVVALAPATAEATEGCNEFGQSDCDGSCVYFDEPIYYFTQDCKGRCWPYIDQREIWVAGAICDGTLCWTFYGCYQL